MQNAFFPSTMTLLTDSKRYFITQHNKKIFFFYTRNVGMNLGLFRAADSKNDISFPKLALVFEIKGIF